MARPKVQRDVSKFPRYTGRRIGRWRLIRFLSRTPGYETWLARCKCGTEREVLLQLVMKGMSRSCGCLNREAIAKRLTKHGMCRAKNRSPEYSLWNTMIQRCENPKAISYGRYGGRGITVCKEWHNFKNFFDDMGLRPSAKHTLERIDNNGPYSPENVRWATRIENARNTRANRFIRFNGQTKTLAEWAETYGISQHLLEQRLNCLHWPIGKALMTPKRGHR